MQNGQNIEMGYSNCRYVYIREQESVVIVMDTEKEGSNLSA